MASVHEFAAGVQVLIKKSYDRVKRVKNRIWKLKELDRERETVDTDDERYAHEKIAMRLLFKPS